MTNVRGKISCKMLAFLLALLTIIAYSIPSSVLTVNAKDAPWKDTAEVKYVNGGGAEGHKSIKDKDADSPSFDAFCMNRHYSMDSSDTISADGTYAMSYRQFHNVTNTRPVSPDNWLTSAVLGNKDEPNTDSYPQTYTTADKEDDLRGQLKRALYFGYVGRKGDLGLTVSDDWYKATQIAVWQICHYGEGYMKSQYSDLQDVAMPTYGSATVRDAAYKLLVNYVFAMKGDDSKGWTYVYPESDIPMNLYLAYKDGKGTIGGVKVQNLIFGELTEDSDNPSGDADTSKPKVSNTTAKVNGTATAVEINKGSEGTFADEVTFSDLVKDTKYTVVSTLFKDGSEFDTETTSVTGPATGTTVTFSKKITESGKYQVKTELKDESGNTVLDTHNGDLGVDSETVTVTIKESPVTGELKTTVTAGGKTATSEAAATLTASEGKSLKNVTDKIDYTGLVKGATYTVAGTLNEVEDGKVLKTIATASADKVAEDTSGSWELTFNFDEGKIEPGKKYVVFESATLIKDAGGKEVKNGGTIKHEDANDTAQTIVVEVDYTSDLTVKKTTSTKKATVGDTVPYTITITNNGDADAENVSVKDIMGKGLTYVSDDQDDGSQSGQNVNWTVDIPAGDSVEIGIDCEVNSDATSKNIANSVIVTDSTNADDVKTLQDDVRFTFEESKDNSGDSNATNKNTKNTNTVKPLTTKTGDDLSLMLWICMTVLSGLIAGAGALARRFEG